MAEREELKRLFELMLLIRVFEPEAERQYKKARIGGYCHLATGQEATHVGAVGAMNSDDVLLAAYRVHGLALARGVEPGAVMAELFGRVDGCAHGRGGSMHLLDVGRGFLGGWGIVGGHLPIATGVALELARRDEPRAVLCELGDGAVNTGAWHESLNLAALWKLPIVFVCENNQYAANNAVAVQHPGPDIAAHAGPYQMPGVVVDGNDVLAVAAATGEAVARARRGEGPSLLECKTYRWHFHFMRATLPPETRPPAEVAAWKARDPIARLAQRGLGEAWLTAADLTTLRERVRAELAEAVAFAEASPFPDPKDLLVDMFAE
jgi:pyruvate dehydrogenase E1 component alpha subunit